MLRRSNAPSAGPLARHQGNFVVVLFIKNDQGIVGFDLSDLLFAKLHSTWAQYDVAKWNTQWRQRTHRHLEVRFDGEQRKSFGHMNACIGDGAAVVVQRDAEIGIVECPKISGTLPNEPTGEP